MRQLSQILNDASLTEEEFREVRVGVVEPKYVHLAGREVLPVRKISVGRQEFGYDTLTDVGVVAGTNQVADVIAKATNFPGMAINKARELLPVLKHGVSFNIAREDLLGSRDYGEPLNTVMARRASKLTQNKENETIVMRNLPFGVNGLYYSVGGTFAGATWGTVANIPLAITGAYVQMGDPFEPTDLICHKDQYIELFQRTTTSDLTEFEKLVKQGITPRLDRDIATGTAILMQSGADIAELIVAEELDVEEDYVLANQSYNFNTFLRSVPAIYEPTAVISITGI